MNDRVQIECRLGKNNSDKNNESCDGGEMDCLCKQIL